MISHEKINEISQANDIVDVIASYIAVKKRGKNFLAVCPFHPDKNPSMTISPEKQLYHCFSCKAGGNVISFVMDYEKISFIEAVEKLAERAGIKIEHSRSGAPKEDTAKLYEINKTAAQYFHNNLINISGSEKDFINSYIAKRGIQKNSIRRFGLGYAEKGWNNLLAWFKDNTDFSETDLQKAGLVKSSEKGHFYDTFRGRLIFPIFNVTGKVIGFGARKLFEDDEIEGKYINTQETNIYFKGKNLYGLNFAKESKLISDFAIMVEGYMDLISLHQSGFDNTVASSGTALTIDQLRLLMRYTNKLVLLFDSDTAGIKAAKSGLKTALEAGMNVSVVILPEGEDPDSVIRTKGPEEFQKYLDNKMSLLQFTSFLRQKEGALNTPEDKTAHIRELLDYIVRIPDKLRQSFYLNEIINKFGVSKKILKNEYLIAKKNLSKEKIPKSSVVLPVNKDSEKQIKEVTKITREEKDLLEIFLKGNEDAIWYIENNLEIRFLQNQHILNLVELFLDEFINEGMINTKKLMNKVENAEERKLITEILFPKDKITNDNDNNKNDDDEEEEEELDKGSVIYQAQNNPIDYLKFARDVIKKFRIKSINNEIKNLINSGSNLSEVLEKVNKLKKQIVKIQEGEE